MIEQLKKGLVQIGLVGILVLIFATNTMGATVQWQADNAGGVAVASMKTQWLGADVYASPRLWGNDGKMELNFREAYLDWSLGKQDLGKWDIGKWHLWMGRKITSIGPGRYGSPILGAFGSGKGGGPNVTPIGGDLWATGYDQIGYSFEWWNMKYQRFYANASEEGFYRALLGQRVTFKLGSFTIGATETALIKRGADLRVYLPIPFVYIYEIQSYYDSDLAVNVNQDIDISWQLTKRMQLYCMYFVDDKPTTNWETPYRVAYQLGMEWQEPFQMTDSSFYFEYTRIDTPTYTSYRPGLNYTVYGNFLGDLMGPDADRVNIEFDKKISDYQSIGVILARERRGEYQIGDPWTITHEELFLTGVVETTYLIGGSYTWKTGNYGFKVVTGLERTDNYKHITGQEHWGARLQVSGEYKF